jgi:outer membrane receptor protein involved in Fe transport
MVFDDDLNTRPLDSYVIVNAQVGWRWTDEVTTFLSVENLLDEEVEVSRSGNALIGIGAPRLIHLGLRLEF